MHQPSVRTEYEKRLAAFYQYLHDLQKQDSVAAIGKATLHFLKEWFQFDLIWIAHCQTQSQVLTGIDGVLPNPGRDQGVLHREQPILPGDLFDQVLLTGRSQQIPSLKQEQRVGEWQAIAQRQGIQGTLVLPIRYRQQPLGILLVGTTLWGGHPRSEELTELKMLTETLGAALYTLRERSGAQPTTHAPHQLADVVDKILSNSRLEDRAKVVLEYIHAVIQPSRTCLYAFDSQEQSCRLLDIYTGSSGKRTTTRSIPIVEVALQDIAAFYQYTLQNPLVAVADVQGMISNQYAPTRLMGMTRSRAWLSAPIFDQGKLVGVLAAEHQEARLWNDQDKQSIQLMAKLLGQGGQSDPTSMPLGLGEQTSLDSLFNALRDTDDQSEQWEKTLFYCLEQIGLQFALRWAAIFTYRESDESYYCRAQFVHKKRQSLPSCLPELSDVDAKLLRRMSAPLGIVSIEQDLRLLNWRQPLADRGAQAYLLIKLNPGKAIGSFLLLGSDLQRTWTPNDMEMAESVGKKLGHLFERREAWLQIQAKSQAMTCLSQGLQSIQQNRKLESLFSVAAQALQQFLGTEALMIVRWEPGQTEGTIAGLINTSKVQIDASLPIPWQTDPLIQELLRQSQTGSDNSASGLAHLRGPIQEWTGQNNGWIRGMGYAEILAIPMVLYPEDPCLGMVVALDYRHQYWSDFQKEGVKLLTGELTAHYRSHYLLGNLARTQKRLECLNWYKQRHLEHLCQMWTEQMSKFQVLLSGPASEGSTGGTGLKGRHRHPAGELYQAFSAMEQILKTEVWDLQLSADTLPLATLLRRALERIEEVSKARQLWIQIHNLTPSVSIQIPGPKLELMLVELLLAACYRSKSGDRIDVWCRVLQDNWIEISITDNGKLNPQLIHALQQRSSQVPLEQSVLESVPGLHFKVCQSLAERLGGHLEVALLEDGRSLSRFILPLTPSQPN
ncbi:MAG TPA: GAF domain-containing protein [Stenomitos sp.]